MATPHPFDQSTLHAIHAAAIDAGLGDHRKRSVLIDDPHVRDRLPHADSAAAQLLADLQTLARAREPDGRRVLLARWLRNAAQLTKGLPIAARFTAWAERAEAPDPLEQTIGIGSTGGHRPPDTPAQAVDAAQRVGRGPDSPPRLAEHPEAALHPGHRGPIAIIYHRADLSRARALAAAITAAGGHAWLTDDLLPGDPIAERTIAALDRAPLVAALVTRRWQTSDDWSAPEAVARVIARLQAEGIGRVVPLLCDGANPHALPYGLFRLKALPITGDAWAPAARQLVALAGGTERPIDEPPAADVPPEHLAPLRLWLDDIADRFDDVPGLTPQAGGRCLSTLFVRLDQRPIEGPGREALLGRGVGGAGRPLDDLLRALPAGRWTVQGDPGAGKTTQLRHLAMERARAARDELAHDRLGPARIPIFAALAVLDLRLADAPHTDAVTVAVDDHLQHALVRAERGALEAALRWAIKAGRALVLLDGFDEVRPDAVAPVRARVAHIERAAGDSGVIVTSRRFGYQRINERFHELELLPLSPQHQRTLLEHWGLPAARINAVMAQVAGRPALQEMAGNPFVLTLMALLARESDAPLPPRRVALYRDVLGLLVKGRLGTAQPGARQTGLEPEPLRAALGELALSLLQDHAGPWTSAELDHHLARLPATAPLLDRLDDAPLAIEADTGLLVALDRRRDRRQTGWRFLHRSLMECLAAEALHRRGEAAAQRFAVQLAGGKWYAPWTWGREEQVGRWAEVYCHLAAMMEQPARFLHTIEQVHPRLAIRAWMSLDVAPASDLLDEGIDLRQIDLSVVRLLIEAVPDRAALGDALARLARVNRENLDGLQLIGAALVAVDQLDHLPAVARLAGGAERLGVPEDAWASIPAGEFWMGSPSDEAGRLDWEGHRHRVQLTKAFELGATQVTQALYAVVTGQNPSDFTGDWRRPVEQVSWDDATAFCAAFGALQGRAVRLPTEAEWEHACRAGTTTRYWSGEKEADLARVGWYLGNAKSTTHPVALKPANPWGLFDVHGNVWEWCQDWFGTYRSAPDGAPLADPAGPATGARRVIRGGSFWDTAHEARSAGRSWWRPDDRGHDLGFRVVRAPRAP